MRARPHLRLIHSADAGSDPASDGDDAPGGRGDRGWLERFRRGPAHRSPAGQAEQRRPIIDPRDIYLA